MKILVLNCGSSSIKYQFYTMETRTILAKGVVEKIGMSDSFLRHEKQNGEQVQLKGEVVDHHTGIEYVLGVLTSKEHGCLQKLSDIEAVGHRVVHGGEHFTQSCLLNEETLKEIKKCIQLAPLHNPANLHGISAIQILLPDVPQVAVFDTAFHQTMPDYAYMYAIPFSLYRKYGIRRYGFHGTSHFYIARRACEILNADITKQKIITCHLGNGASVAAILNGKSVDTSMGLTPVEGLIMGTRSGDVDPGVLTFIINKEDISSTTANTMINKHSGMLGITGVSSDMRKIIKAADNGDERANLGLKMYRYRVKKYIGSYIAVLGGLDILIFTGGIGENDTKTREQCCEGLNFLGIELDKKINEETRGKEAVISNKSSRVTVMTVPTNEELIIAEDTQKIVTELKRSAI